MYVLLAMCIYSMRISRSEMYAQQPFASESSSVKRISGIARHANSIEDAQPCWNQSGIDPFMTFELILYVYIKHIYIKHIFLNYFVQISAHCYQLIYNAVAIKYIL